MVTKKKFKFLKINQINFKPKKLLWTQQEYGKNQLKGVWFPTAYINETKIKVESQYNNMGIEDDYSRAYDDTCWAQWKAPTEDTTREF